MRLKPLSLKAAGAYIREHHRHHKPPRFHKFSIGLLDDGELVGVCVVDKPTARAFDDGFSAEVSRMATDGTKNACSMLYGAAWRAAKGMGYDRIYTYTLQSEPGVSLRGAGWREDGTVRGRSWNTPSRPRVDKTEVQQEHKIRWIQGLDRE
jgi:hypothetical protein